MENKKAIFLKTASLVVMAMWLAGCSTLNHAARNGPIPKGESIVFGNIKVTPSEANWTTHATITVIDTRNSKIVLEHPIKGVDRSFYWSLPPGQYAILDLEESPFSLLDQQTTSSSRIFAQFSVDSTQTVTYIGTLVLASSPPTVTDDFASAVKAFHNRFSALDTKMIKKQLLRLGKAL